MAKVGRKRTNTRHPHSLETRAWIAKNRKHHNWYTKNYMRMTRGQKVDPEWEEKYAGKLVNQVRMATKVARARARQDEDSHEIGTADDSDTPGGDKKRRSPLDAPRGISNWFRSKRHPQTSERKR